MSSENQTRESRGKIQDGIVTLTQGRTFFQNTKIWPMNDSADPLNGWFSKEVADTSSGPASADIYGKLFYYIHGLLRSFLDRLSSLNISFKIFQLDVTLLPDHIEDNTLTRIEVSD